MKTHSFRHVIIGNSVAAVAAAEAIRELEPTASLAMVSSESQAAYSRPLITHLLRPGEADAKLRYREPEWYAQMGIGAFLGRRVTGIEADRRLTTFEDGVQLHYERLLIATGGRPVAPDLPGGDLRGVFAFTSWEDAVGVAERIEQTRVQRAVVVGAGMIGVKAAEALVERGVETTIVELADRPLSQALDAVGSERAAEAICAAGVRLLTGETVAAIVGNRGEVAGCTLAGGDLIPCELVVLAIGVTPDTRLAQTAGIEVGRGILVDDRMQTSVPDVYAAGDVAEARGLLTPGSLVVAVWPNAYRQGTVAGTNMAGGDATFAGSLPMNSISVFGMPTISAGDVTGDDRCEVLTRDAGRGGPYRRVVLRDDRIVGFLCVGEITSAGILTGLLRSQADVGRFKEALAAPDFGLISLPREIRKHIVSGTAIEV